jgi:hypothetical protein
LMFSCKYQSLLLCVPPIYHGLWHQSKPPKNKNHTTLVMHQVVTIHCHKCNADSMLFHYVTCYTNSLLSPIHVNITKILNIMCTLVATGVMLRSVECIGVLKRKVTT